MAIMHRDSALSRAMSRFFGATQSNVPARSANSPHDIVEMLRAEGDEYGANVSPDAAMRVAAVYACVRLLSTSQAMLPLQLVRSDGERNTVDTMHPVHKVLRRPNRWQTAFEFESMMSAHKHLRGNAYAYMSRMGGKVIELIPLRPDYVQVEQTASLELRYVYAVPGKPKRVYAQSEIHHRRGLTTDGIIGLSPLSAARKAIDLAIQTERHGRVMFANAAKPSGVLKSPKPLTNEAAARLRESFDSVYAGEENAHRTIVLEDGLDWSQVSMTAEDSQFIESRKFQRNEIAMFYGVPPHMIGDIDRGTSWGSGIEQQGLGFLIHTLNPHLVNDQQALARDLLREADQASYSVNHDTSILTRAQFMTRQQGLEIQLRNGVINPNEWRKIEGLNPRQDSEGDDYVKPSAGGSLGGGSASGGADPSEDPDAASEDTEDNAPAN